MRASDLREGYKRAIASPLDISVIDAENEKPFILYSNDWIRILLVRRPDESANSIEVELTHPGVLGQDQTQLADAILELIAYLKYLLQLRKVGFALDLIEDDFLWTATLEISTDPTDQIFEVLVPPNK